jgi:membrane-associated HD superfamily phosphohydrolase
MAIQALTSFIYQAVQQSWLVSTVLVKYIVLVHIAELLYRHNFNLKHLEEIVLKYSHIVVASIVVLGFLTALLGISFEPVFETLSQLIAVIYFGFLFWKF